MNRTTSRLLAAAACVVVAATAAPANADATAWTPERIEQRHRVIRDVYTRLYLEGRTSAEVDAVLLAEFGLVAEQAEVPELGGVHAASTNQMVNLPRPDAYYDAQIGRHVVFGRFQWKHNCDTYYCWRHDVNGDTTNVGKLDGFSVSASKTITKYGTGFSTYGSGNWSNHYSNPWNSSNYGFAFKAQDKYGGGFNGDYSWDHGTMSMTYAYQGCGTYSFRTKLAHTWGSTDLTGVSIGSGGVSFSFSSTNNRWQAATPNELHVTRC